MNVTRALLVLSLLVAGSLAAARTSDGAATTLAAPLAGDAVAGKQTFTEYCSICHGVGAKGFIGPKIGGINWTTPGLHAIVRAGVGGYGGMPAFNADAVSDRKIADIAAYLAALAPPSPAQPTPQPTTTPAPLAVAAAPASTPDAAHGRQVYQANCAACHGANAQGGIGPNLRGEKSRKDTAAATAWIKNPRPPMPKLYPAVLSAKDVDDVAAYIESL